MQSADFETIVRIIQEAHKFSFSKVNGVLVLLYFTLRNGVLSKVSEGVLGDRTLDAPAEYNVGKLPALSGFNRLRLYIMQTYSQDADSHKLWLKIHSKNEKLLIVSPVMTQISWTNHLPFFTKAKLKEKKHFNLKF